MIFVVYLVVISILVRDIASFSRAMFVMRKGGLDDDTTAQLLTDFRANLPGPKGKRKLNRLSAPKPPNSHQIDSIENFIALISTVLAQLRNESQFCAKPDDEKALICMRLLASTELRKILQLEFSLTSFLNQFDASSFQCRKRKVRNHARSSIQLRVNRRGEGSTKKLRFIFSLIYFSRSDRRKAAR